MKRTRSIVFASAAFALLGGAQGAASAATAPAGDGSGQAVVTVSTPQLPTGRSEEARTRWKERRAEANRILGSVISRHDLEPVNRIPEIGQLTVETGTRGIDGLRRALADDPRVEKVTPARQVELRYVPNDPGMNLHDPNAPNGDLYQWNLAREGGPLAWEISRGGGATVAVIDSGVAFHPDLDPRVVAQDGFGLLPLDNPRNDTVGHGTHVAGVACGDSDNGYGIASLGFDCSIVAAKINLDALNSCSLLGQAIVTEANRLADAINMSLGGCDASSVAPAIDYAWSRGSVPVAAGDNFPTPNPTFNYPAEAVQPEGTGPDINAGKGLVVTAAKYSGDRAAFAQRTTGVSVAAFGAASDVGSCGQQGIFSSYPAASTDIDSECGSRPLRANLNGDTRFAYLVGTSMATPQVAGLVALIRAARPGLPAPQVMRLVKLTSSNCGHYVNGTGWGLIRADHALAAAVGRDIEPPASQVIGAKLKRRSVVKLRLRSSDVGCGAELPSSGLRETYIFASVNNGDHYQIAKTNKAVVRFTVKPKRHYSFYSVAIDNARNREPEPPTPDLVGHLIKKRHR